MRLSTHSRKFRQWPFGLVALGLALLAGAPGASAAVDEQAFINLFRGAWVGSGTVLKFSAPLTVSCRAVGRPTTNRVVIDGSCSVSIISVRIGADITYDPQADRYTGTYIGAKVGPRRKSSENAAAPPSILRSPGRSRSMAIRTPA